MTTKKIQQPDDWCEARRLQAWELKQKGWKQKAIAEAPGVSFLKHLLRHIPGQLHIRWDGLPAHRGQAVKDFLRQGAAQHIHLERLPGYAPDLNPDEGIWHYLKQVEMKNLCGHNRDELHHELRKAAARLRHKTDVILACFQQAGLAVQV